jgi:hypothetical protein
MKTSSSAFVNSLLVYSLVAIGCTGTVGLGMVWSRHEISTLANDNKQLTTRITALDRQCQEVTAEIAAQEDPVALLKSNERWHLGLQPPAPERLYYVPRDPAMALAAKRDRGLYNDRALSVNFPVAVQP